MVIPGGDSRFLVHWLDLQILVIAMGVVLGLLVHHSTSRLNHIGFVDAAEVLGIFNAIDVGPFKGRRKDSLL